MPNLPLRPGQLLFTCYPETPQELYAAMFEAGYAFLSDSITGVIKQDATPSADETGSVWIRTSGGRPVNPPLWIYYNGQWVAPHPVPPSDPFSMIYTGLAADIATIHGGAAAAVTENTGPFWEIDTSYEARFPVGVGVFPSNASVAQGGTGGEELHEILSVETPAHIHTDLQGDSGGHDAASSAITGNARLLVNTAGGPLTSIITHSQTGSSGGAADGTTTPHNNLPPYIGRYFLRRTARVLLTAPIS